MTHKGRSEQEFWRRIGMTKNASTKLNKEGKDRVPRKHTKTINSNIDIPYCHVWLYVAKNVNIFNDPLQTNTSNFIESP